EPVDDVLPPRTSTAVHTPVRLHASPSSGYSATAPPRRAGWPYGRPALRASSARMTQERGLGPAGARRQERIPPAACLLAAVDNSAPRLLASSVGNCT
ncbi:hypothetical protein CspHIS471_0200010, partial [Cutaneotrichosporon sp. HIS471]